MSSLSRIFLRSLPLVLLAGASTAQTLTIDTGLVAPAPGPFAAVGSVPQEPDNQVALTVAGGPAGGQGFLAFASSVVPPLPTTFGDLVLNPTGITLLGTFGLSPVGGGGIASTFSTLPGSFQQAFQVATLNTGTLEVSLTGAGLFGYGADLQLSRLARIAYTADTDAYKVVITNKFASPQATAIEHFDASAGTTTVLDSATVPGGSFPGVAFIEYTGTVVLDSGDALIARITGSEIARIDS